MSVVEPGSSEPVSVVGSHVIIRQLAIDNERLAAWLSHLSPDERPTEVVDLLQLGLLVRDEHGAMALTEALQQTAESTVAALDARIKHALLELDGKLTAAQRTLTEVFSLHVTGDQSQLRRVVTQAVDDLGRALSQGRRDLQQALDPQQTESVGALLETRLREQLRALTDSTLVPQLTLVQQAIARLEATVRGEERVIAERNRGAGKGKSYEIALLEAIHDYALPGDMLVERVADKKGANGSKDGDLVIAYNGDPLVVIECKDAQKSDLAQLESALAGRRAPVGILCHKRPGGPTQGMGQGTCRVVADDKLLFVWDPEQDSVTILTVVVQLAILLARHIRSGQRQTAGVGPDLQGAQRHLNHLMESLDVTDQLVLHYDRILIHADKGKKILDKLKREWAQDINGVATALGIDTGID